LARVLRAEVAGRERHRAEATVFLGRRLRQLANEREKLLRAYYADAIDVTTLKREQTRINAEVAARQRPRKGGCRAPPPSDPVSIPQDIENREVATRID